MTTAVDTQTRPTYSDDEKRQALVVFASQNGREDHVRATLAQFDLGHIPIGTIRSWAYRDRRDEYEQIKVEWEAHVRSRAADTFRNVASVAAENVAESQRQIKVALAEGAIPLKQLPGTSRESATVAGIFNDKAEAMGGNPTSIVRVDVDELDRELASSGVVVVMAGIDPPKQPADDQRALPAAPVPERNP